MVNLKTSLNFQLRQRQTLNCVESACLGIFKTIYLFLLNHNFPQAAEVFKNECGLYSGNLDTVSGRSLLLKKCKCSKNQANQTDERNVLRYKDERLEGTYEEGPFRLKDDQTNVFYVCDHCRQTMESNARKPDMGYSEGQEDKINEKSAPCSDVLNLQLKFSELQSEHQKLIAVTSELTTVIQTNIIGQTKTIHSVLEHCKSIYPSLFMPTSPRIPFFENVENVGKLHGELVDNMENNGNFNVYAEGDNEKENRRRERTESPERHQNVELLNLESLSPCSPLKTPLTPETVRQILETVFEKIFELEKSRHREKDGGHILNHEDVEKIVTDVLGDLSKAPLSLYGAGEGVVSRPQSNKGSLIMRNETFFDVDYSKIKRDLVNSDNEKKIRILQALRWRITKTEGSVREKVLESYVTNDILDLCAGISLPERILVGYGNDHYVQESTCRLINTLASVRQGRDYLTMDERLLKRVLLERVKEMKTVTSAVIRNMLVASVQKLSIRKHCRNQMVHEGLFEVLVDYLEEFYDKLSKYCLEYCSALLMNLCLVEEAKQRSTKNPKKVIGLIKKVLEGDNQCCLPYINGVMFSLLEKEDIVSEAKNQNLDKLLIRLIRVTKNDNIRKQLDFIVQSRIIGTHDTNVVDTDEEAKDEVDLLEIELDQDDFITQLPSGEKLLKDYKTVTNNNDSKFKSENCVSFASMKIKKDPPPSPRSFSEENKQFYHKPSTDRGIFEATKNRRYSNYPQNVIRNYVTTKKQNQSGGRYPATPLCYMENCQRQNEESSAQCSCFKCIPGQSRYSCGCYDAICRDIVEVEKEDDNNFANYSRHIDFEKHDAKNSQLSVPQIADMLPSKYDGHVADTAKLSEQPTAQIADKLPSKCDDQIAGTAKLSEQSTAQNNNIALVEQLPDNDNKKGGRTGSSCRVCGEKKCECAFDSKPKLCRTPTL